MLPIISGSVNSCACVAAIVCSIGIFESGITLHTKTRREGVTAAVNGYPNNIMRSVNGKRIGQIVTIYVSIVYCQNGAYGYVLPASPTWVEPIVPTRYAIGG